MGLSINGLRGTDRRIRMPRLQINPYNLFICLVDPQVC